MAKIKAVCISENKGEKKKAVASIQLIAGHGVVGDAHAGSPRQISLLAEESINKMRERGLGVGPGDFAENITTEGMVLHELPLGTRIRVGEAEIEINQVGKVCHDRCAIYYQAGDCVMPKEGVFARVISSGQVKEGDEIKVV